VYDYTRSGNPTRALLERNMAELEGGVAALAFVTGMAAINAAVRLVGAGAVYRVFSVLLGINQMEHYARAILRDGPVFVNDRGSL
jgi:O-acetylhomoserine/O-acetylserine sulfhydrylase-like pyridoxal-dependent enzyme